MKLPIGTRIRFVKRLDCGPTEEHPALLYAAKGQLGEVLHHDCSEGHFVKADGWPSGFGATIDEEFEEAK